MAAGSETQTTKPESVLFSAGVRAVGAAQRSPERPGHTGCTFAARLRRHFDGNASKLVRKHVTFSAKQPSFSES